jgi:sec-independent protein translocase protein TatA
MPVTQIAFLDIGAPELIIVLVILLLLFGSKKLPELSRSIGDSMRELRSGMSGDTNHEEKKNKEKTESTNQGAAQ